jgi:hypothetical protein
MNPCWSATNDRFPSHRTTGVARTATVRGQTAPGEKAEQSEATRRRDTCVGRSFGERTKDLHLDGAVHQPFFLAT